MGKLTNNEGTKELMINTQTGELFMRELTRTEKVHLMWKNGFSMGEIEGALNLSLEELFMFWMDLEGIPR